MIDAFGVSKSLVAAGKWKAAKDLTQAERVIVRNAKLHRAAKNPPVDDFKAPKTGRTPRSAMHQGKRNRVLGPHSKDRFMLLGPNDERKLVHRSNLTFVKDKKISKYLDKVDGGWIVRSKEGKPLSKPSSRKQAAKRLREIEYFKSVSKSAKSDRNWHAGMAAGNAAVGGLAAAGALKSKGALNRSIMGGWAGLSGAIAAKEASQARKANKKVKFVKKG